MTRHELNALYLLIDAMIERKLAELDHPNDAYRLERDREKFGEKWRECAEQLGIKLPVGV